MDLKICFSSRCLLLCEAMQAAKPDGTVTEPVYTQTSFCQICSGQGAALESQKYKAAKTKEVRINKERERTRVKTATSGSKGTTEWGLVVKTRCL